MFTIQDGRDRFYQWDRNVRLNIGSDVSEVHFVRSCMKEPLTVEVDTSGDVPSVKVPNILLQTHGGMIVYAYVQNEDSSYTKAVESFNIQKRPKPVDYVYTETEVITFDTLRKELINKVNLPKDEEGNVAHGAAGQVLKTNGDGTTEWIYPPSGGSISITDDGEGNVTIGG